MKSPSINTSDNFFRALYFGYKNWKTSILTLFVIVFIVGGFMIRKMPYTYHSEFRIMPVEDDSLMISDITNPNSISDMLLKKPDNDRDEQIYRILQSRTLIQKVAEKLNLAEPGSKKMSKLIDTFFNSFFIFQKDGRSKTYRISIKYFSPQIAYDFCNGIIDELNAQISVEEMADKENTINLIKNYITQTQISKINAENAIASITKSENKKAVYAGNSFLKENFDEHDFTTLGKSALIEMIKTKIASLTQIESLINQQYQLVLLKEKNEIKNNNKKYFTMVDQPQLLNFPDAPDKKLLYVILVIASLAASIGYIYARIYFENTLKSLDVA